MLKVFWHDSGGILLVFEKGLKKSKKEWIELSKRWPGIYKRKIGI